MPCSATTPDALDTAPQGPGPGPRGGAAKAAVTRTSPSASAWHARLQSRRRATQIGFFLLFLLAPALNLLRFDLNEAQLWFLGQRWTLGIDPLLRGQADATRTALSIFVKGILPGVGLAVGFLAVARQFGRVYCGWLCPHFSLVELLNNLLHRACGRFSVWDTERTGHGKRQADRRWWLPYVVAGLFFGFLWAVTLLTYLLPPFEIWGRLIAGTLTPNQARFIGVGTALFAAELLLARHLFCRFGCAVGLFQSLAWMSNPRALVMAFDRQRASDCRGCATAHHTAGEACEAVCPMRLQPRRIKRLMFSCVQCGRCLQACSQSHGERSPAPNLQWTIGVDALRETLKQHRRDG